MEIVYAETVWHVFSLFAVFLIGLLAFAARPFRSVSVKFSVTLYLWHTFFCLYYMQFSLYNTSDARAYFTRSNEMDLLFSLGTKAVVFVTSIFTQFAGLSYLGTFLVYNIIGGIGLLAFAAAISEALGEKSRRIRLYASCIVFLPGVSFWSAAIGKDALAFFGSGLLCWAVLDLRRRWIAVLLGIASFMIVRPHIVTVILVSLLLAFALPRKIGFVKKFGTVAILAVPIVLALQLSITTIGLGETGAFSSAEDFIEYRQSLNLVGGGAIDISGMFLPLQMFLYGFGPLFGGTGGLMGLIASTENAFLLLLVSISAVRMPRHQSSLPPTAKWFYFFFALFLWIVLATTTANLGIALRQKWMFMPMLLLFCLSFFPKRTSGA